MRRQGRTNSTIFTTILAILDYILLMGLVWGNYALFACLHVEDMPAAIAAAFFGYLSAVVGFLLLVFLFIKNRFNAFLVLGLAIISYGISFVATGALSEQQAVMITLIVLGIVFIGIGAGMFLMAATEFNKQTGDGGLNLDHVEHRGRVFGQNAGVNIQTNRGPTIANV